LRIQLIDARLVESGGIAAAWPRDVAEKTEILITSLPTVDAFIKVMTGEGGVASSNGRGQIVIECSTLPIEVKARGKAQLAAQGKILLDCPAHTTPNRSTPTIKPSKVQCAASSMSSGSPLDHRQFFAGLRPEEPTRRDGFSTFPELPFRVGLGEVYSASQT
jgi:hypothetical protein